MKFLVLLGLLASCASYADFVYMREDAQGKSIQLQGSSATTLNDSSSKLWAIYPDITPDGNEFIYAEGAGPEDLHLTYLNKKKNLTQRFQGA